MYRTVPGCHYAFVTKCEKRALEVQISGLNGLTRVLTAPAIVSPIIALLPAVFMPRLLVALLPRLLLCLWLRLRCWHRRSRRRRSRRTGRRHLRHLGLHLRLMHLLGLARRFTHLGLFAVTFTVAVALAGLPGLLAHRLRRLELDLRLLLWLMLRLRLWLILRLWLLLRLGLDLHARTLIARFPRFAPVVAAVAIIAIAVVPFALARIALVGYLWTHRRRRGAQHTLLRPRRLR
jgi:hypothetical protein